MLFFVKQTEDCFNLR